MSIQWSSYKILINGGDQFHIRDIIEALQSELEISRRSIFSFGTSTSICKVFIMENPLVEATDHRDLDWLLLSVDECSL